MYLKLNHQKLQVYQVSQRFILECYKLTSTFPAGERFILTAQITRAALSAHLNIAEGASRKSIAERKRFFEISRSSIVEIDAALDVASDLKYMDKEESAPFGKLLISCFKLLSRLIDS